MAWTAPRTWVDGETPTAAMLNAHLRDNLEVLKVTRDSVGRVSGLNSGTLADLSAANVTGLARPGAANSFTAGRTRFTGAVARCVIPVGANKYEDLGAGLRRGVWVEGDYLHHIASDQTTEWRYLGSYVSTPAGAVEGSVWIEGEYLHYIDADGDERRCLSVGMPGHADAAAVAGSWWVEVYQHWIHGAGTNEVPGHADVSHSDVATVHTDTHSDVAHQDSHGDVGFSDSHGDSHNDVAHQDFAHDDHFDLAEIPKHVDIAHGDLAHNDTHSDSHSDVAHDDDHSDSHTDTHTDHGDHGDVSHSDQPTVVP
jgi:hypothetical protein